MIPKPNMNNNIVETKCSYEVGKLLKEKGFRVQTFEFYTQDGLLHFNTEESFGEREYSFDFKDFKDNWNWYTGNGIIREVNGKREFNLVAAPTHAVAIEWIRINFGIQLFLDYTFYDGFHYGYKWVKSSGEYEEVWLEGVDNDIDGTDTAEEATEAILKYTLKNLIP